MYVCMYVCIMYVYCILCMFTVYYVCMLCVCLLHVTRSGSSEWVWSPLTRRWDSKAAPPFAIKTWGGKWLIISRRETSHICTTKKVREQTASTVSSKSSWPSCSLILLPACRSECMCWSCWGTMIYCKKMCEYSSCEYIK